VNRHLAHIAGLFLTACLCLGLLLWASVAAAADMSGYSVRTERIYRMSISACVNKESAVAILDAEKKSHEDASKLFDKLDECFSMPMEFRVGKVVHSIYTRGTIYRVVEIEVPQNPSDKAYWLTSMQVLEAMGARSDAVHTADKVQPT